MNSTDFSVIDAAIAVKLALCLGHFLWQGTVIGLVATVAASFGRRHSHWQYAVQIVALVLMATCLPMNLQWIPTTESISTHSFTASDVLPSETVSPTDREHPVVTMNSQVPTGVLEPPVVGEVNRADMKPVPDNDVTSVGEESRQWRLADVAPILVMTWLTGVGVLFLRLLLATLRGVTLRREASAAPESLKHTLESLRSQVGIARHVFVGCCDSLVVPVAIGIFRPAILIPSAVMTGLSPDQLELVLLHELQHFRRRDHLVVVLQRLVETLLFFHPFVWIVSRQVSIQREHCCDEDVVSAGATPVDYASCLLRIAELQPTRGPAHSVSLAANGHRPSQLRSRVSRILGLPDPTHGRFALSGVLSLTLLLTGCLWSLTREEAVAESDDTEVVETTTSALSDDDPIERPQSVPDVVSLRLTLEKSNGNAVKFSEGSFESASRGYADASATPVSMQGGTLRLKPGKQTLAYRPHAPGRAMLVNLDVPPRDSSLTVQLREPAAWARNDGVRLELEAEVHTREFGDSIAIKFRNAGEDDYTFAQPDLQFVTRHWRIIPPQAIHLHGYTLSRSGGEHTRYFDWSSIVRSGIWIPRTREEVTEDLPALEPGKIHLGLQVGPTFVANLGTVEDPDLVVARDERFCRDGKVAVELDKPEFVLGENVLLHYSVTNQGEEPLRIYVGGDYRGSPRSLRFKVHAYDEAGKRLPDPHPNPWNMGGLGIHPELKQYETYWLSIPLLDYVRFEKPGTYRVRVFHDLGWNEWTEIPETIDNSMPGSDAIAPIVETTIRLRKPTDTEARAVLEETEKPRPETSWGHRSPPHGAWSALRHPIYLRLLVDVATKHDPAIQSIASITTPEATDALIRLAENGSSVAEALLPERLPHPNFQKRENWNESWSMRERDVRNSWRDDYADRVRQIAWRLLESDETEPYEERKSVWMLGSSILLRIGRAENLPRFIAAANPIVESLGTVAAEQQQYPSPATVIADFVSTGRQLIERGARPETEPRTAFESMMFMTAIGTDEDFRPAGWQTLARRLMKHSMPRVRSTCVGNLPRPIEQQFVAPIIALFSDSSPLVAAAALLSVGAAKDERFLEAALKASRDAQDEWVRGAASSAAANCKPAEKHGPKPAEAASSLEASLDARIKLLKAQIAVKEVELDRTKQLFKRGFVTQLEVQKLELKLKELTQTLSVAESAHKDEVRNAAEADREQDSVEAQQEALDAAIKLARVELERTTLLFKKGLVGRPKVEALQSKLELLIKFREAKDDARKAEAALKRAEAAARKATLKVSLTGEPVAGVPLILQLDVTNHTDTPFNYWWGGPGEYPNASMFVAEITDSAGQTRKVVLQNGQYIEGSGVNRKVEKRTSLPAVSSPLPPGRYTITVSCAQTAVLAGVLIEQWPAMKSEPLIVEIRDEPESVKRFNDQLLESAEDNPFAKHVTRVYGIAPIVNDWLQQLLDDDPAEAFKSVGYLARCRRLPKGGDEIIVQAARKHLKAARQDRNLLRYISMIARNVASDTTVDACLAIATEATDGYARGGAINDLAEFANPAAERLLEELAEDPQSPTYWPAIEALAAKRSRIALRALIDASETDDEDRRRHIVTLLENFPNDPEAVDAIRKLAKPLVEERDGDEGQEDADNATGEEIEAALITKERRRKLLDGRDSFLLQLYYYGPSDKPFYSLHLQTKPIDPNNFFVRSHQLDRTQLNTLVDGLARGGFLKNGNDEGRFTPTYKEGYVMFLSGVGHSQHEILGFPDNQTMVERLIALQSFLEGDAARSMSLLLGRIGVRPEQLPQTKPVERVPLPEKVRLRVFQGPPESSYAQEPVIDQEITPGEAFDLEAAGITTTGRLFEAVTGRPRFKATVRYNGGTNEFDAEITLGKPLRSYGGGFSGGILSFFVQLDPVE